MSDLNQTTNNMNGRKRKCQSDASKETLSKIATPAKNVASGNMKMETSYVEKLIDDLAKRNLNNWSNSYKIPKKKEQPQVTIFCTAHT